MNDDNWTLYSMIKNGIYEHEVSEIISGYKECCSKKEREEKSRLSELNYKGSLYDNTGFSYHKYTLTIHINPQFPHWLLNTLIRCYEDVCMDVYNKRST